jgi:hypothetical protein
VTKTLLTVAVITAALAMTAQARPAQDASKFEGKWYSVDQDSREFRIERTRDGLKMMAPDLACTIKHLQIHRDGISGLSADGQFECFDESEGARGTWLLKLFDSGYLAVVEHTTAIGNAENGSWKKQNATTNVAVYSRRNEHPAE